MSDYGKTVIRLSWKDIRDILLFLPFLHVALCFLFLLFYSLSFYGSIEVFYLPSDVFSVSFRDIAPGYIVFFILLPLALVASQRVRSSRDHTEAVGKGKVSKEQGCLLFIILIASLLFFVISMIAGVIYFKLTGRVPVSSAVGAAFGILYPVLIYRHSRDTRKWLPILGMIVSYPFLVTSYAGAHTAESESVIAYSDLIRVQPTCGDFALVRSVGDYFVAVAKDERRVIIDKECKPRFNLPSQPVVPTLPK